VVDRSGSLRPLYGLPSLLAPGSSVEAGVISAACSDRLVLIKTGSALEVRDAELRVTARWPAPPGPARFAISANGSAAAYFVQTRELLAIEGAGAPRPLGHALQGEALAIAMTGEQQLDAVVLIGGVAQLVRISLAKELSNNPGDTPARFREPNVQRGQPGVSPDCSIERYTELPEITGGPVMLLADETLVYADGANVAIRRPGGVEQRFALAASPVSRQARGAYQLGKTRAPQAKTRIVQKDLQNAGAL